MADEPASAVNMAAASAPPAPAVIVTTWVALVASVKVILKVSPSAASVPAIVTEDVAGTAAASSTAPESADASLLWSLSTA